MEKKLRSDMKLFVLNVIGRTPQGEFVKFVILAPDEERARKLAQERDSGRYVKDKWSNPEKTSCTEIVKDCEEKIISAEFTSVCNWF